MAESVDTSIYGPIRLGTNASIEISTTTDRNFGTWGLLSPNYTGSRAIFSNNANATTTISGHGSLYGTADFIFDLESIDISELVNTSTYADTSITFFAQLLDGSVTSQTVQLDGIFGNETFYFNDTFAQIRSVWWDQTPDWHQFDNVVMNNVSIVAPLPAAAWLFISGIVGLTGYGWRNRFKR